MCPIDYKQTLAPHHERDQVLDPDSQHGGIVRDLKPDPYEHMTPIHITTEKAASLVIHFQAIF